MRSTRAGADFLQLDASGVPVGGLADWLAGELRRAVSDGRLRVGSRLPATRVLAGDLGVSRGVVTEAYRRLVEDGQVVGLGRAGTVVVAAPLAVPNLVPNSEPGPGLGAGSGAPHPATAGPRVTSRGHPGPFVDRPGAEVFEAVRAAPARIDLTPGVPDLAAFPRAGWLRAERAVLAGLSSADFGYGDPRGAPDGRGRGAGRPPGEARPSVRAAGRLTAVS
jgi:GntR family transcriptional regulator/MocR family aminotransferase